MKRRYYFLSDALNGKFSMRCENDAQAKHLSVCFYSMYVATYVAVFNIDDFGGVVFRPELSFGDCSKFVDLKDISDEGNC